MLKVIKKIASFTWNNFFSSKFIDKSLDIPAYRHDARWQRYRRVTLFYSKLLIGSILGLGILDFLTHVFESFLQSHHLIPISLSIGVILYALGLMLSVPFMIFWDSSLRRKINLEMAEGKTMNRGASHQQETQYQGRYAMMQQQKAGQSGEHIHQHPELQFSDMQGLDHVISDYFGIKHQNKDKQHVTRNMAIEKEKESK